MLGIGNYTSDAEDGFGAVAVPVIYKGVTPSGFASTPASRMAPTMEPWTPSLPNCRTHACASQAWALAKAAARLPGGDDGMRAFMAYYQYIRGSL